MILRLLFSLLIFLKVQVNSQNSFCFVLCDAQNDCDSYQYYMCKGNCKPNLVTGPVTSSNFACYSESTTGYVTTTNPRYQPAGASSDIPYNIYGTNPAYIPIYPVTITSSLTAGATKTCINLPDHNYVYYGDNYVNDFFTINHPGIAVGKVFKVRILYGIMRLDDWSTSGSSKVVTQFLSNTSESIRQNKIDNGDMKCKSVCNSGQNQCYRTVDQSFRYNLTTPFSFKISVIGMTGTGTWGIREVVIMAELCHPYCLTCFGDTRSQCFTCDYTNFLAMLTGNNTICGLNCTTYYGFNPANPSVCMLCSSFCKSCYGDPYYCTACISGAYMYDLAPPNVTCVMTCPEHSFPNTTTQKCDMCDYLCGNCTTTFNHCTTCNLTYFLYNNYCYNPCPTQTYNNSATTCANCFSLCYTCSGTSTNCSVCDINGTTKSYLYTTNNTCVTNCTNGFFQDTSGGGGPNYCTPCDIACLTCDVNSTYCFSCDVGYYLYLNTCGPTCTQPGYFADDVTRTCLLCNVYCVGLSLRAYFPDKLKNQLYCDLTFTQDLNWTTTQVTNFVTITQDDPVLDVATNFIVTYQVISPKRYRIRIQPKGYIFLYNITFTFQTAAMGAVLDRAINGRPFRFQNYGVIANQKWFLIKAPSMSATQKMIVDGVANMSQTVLSFTTLPFVQQIKKTGIFAYLLGGAQATSLSCLVNSIPSQNLYEGVRLWASFVYFDVPDWQADSNKTKYVVIPDVKQVIKDARLLSQHQTFLARTLFDTQTLQWRFNRTGHTSFFIFDVYMNIALIVLCWILILIANCCIEHKIKYKKYLGKFYAFTMKVHQFSIFYITLTTLMQWIFFDAASAQRWVSFIICICFNIYFFCFELYVYYDMIKYPRAQIGNQAYEYYCLKYGSLLKNIRFEQYDPAQPWSAKHWFRPYNYHIMSYYKKFLMLISLPIFYYTPHAQVSVLILIQIFQIIRFLVVWPFKSKIRNFIRLGLDFLLFVFFGTVLVQGFAIIQIMKTDPETLQQAVQIFYNIGWLGFVSCWVFNIGFLIITIYDIVIGCRKSNRSLMDQARKMYYMQKLNTYQQENQDVPLSLINKWVKLGNLNDRKYDELPDINLRLQCYRILKSKKGYQVQMKKLVDLFMNIQFNFQNDNNISAGKKHNKRFTLNKALSPQFYNTVHTLYQKYSNHLEFEYLTIKTFQKVIQSAMKPGQKIVLKPEEMFQKIQLQTYAGQTKTIKLDKILSGFPIDEENLKNII